MKKLTIFTMVICAMLAVAANASTIVYYDAGPAGGGPANLDPVLQGFPESANEVAPVGNTEFGYENVGPVQPDGTTGYNAWQLNDQQGSGDPDNPGYQYFLDSEDFQRMFDYGWTLELRLRNPQGGGFYMWGINPVTATDPGWGLGTIRERVGIGVSRDAADGAQLISPVGGTAVNLGPGSADVYHVIKATGAAGSSTVDLYIDGVLNQSYDIKDGTSNSSSDNRCGIQSGSSGGVGRVTNFNLYVFADHSPAASPLTPADGEIDVPIADDTVTWAAPFGGNPVTGYTVTYAPNDPNFLTNPLTATVSVAGDVLSAELIAAGDMDFDTIYYWRVDTTDDTAAVYESTVSSFTTLPEYPVIIAPAVAGVTVAIGDPAVLTVAHLNGADFQWYQDGAPVGANDAILTIASTQTTDEGIYHCVVSNGAGTATSGDAVVMTKRQIAHWDFEAASLTDSIDGWVGTFTDPNEANPAPDPAPRFVAGYDGSGFEFAGDALHVEVAGTEELFNFYPQGLTVACWVKATGGSGANSSMVAKHTYSTDTELGLVRAGFVNSQSNSSGIPRLSVDGWGGMNGPSIVNVQDGSWHHVVMTFNPDYDPVDNPDRTQGRVYVNGGGVTYDVECAASWLRSSGTSAGVPDIRWDVPLRIGCDDENGGGSLAGIVDEVKIWTYPLSPAEVAAEYTTYEAGANICTDLVDFDITGPDGCPDCVVSLYDFALFAGAWMDTNLVP